MNNGTVVLTALGFISAVYWGGEALKSLPQGRVARAPAANVEIVDRSDITEQARADIINAHKQGLLTLKDLKNVKGLLSQRQYLDIQKDLNEGAHQSASCIVKTHSYKEISGQMGLSESDCEAWCLQTSSRLPRDQAECIYNKRSIANMEPTERSLCKVEGVSKQTTASIEEFFIDPQTCRTWCQYHPLKDSSGYNCYLNDRFVGRFNIKDDSTLPQPDQSISIATPLVNPPTDKASAIR